MDMDDTTAENGFQGTDTEALFKRYGPIVLWRCRRMLGATAANALLSMIACSDEQEVRVGNRSLLRKLFGHHPESNRVIAVLHYVDGMTLEETAREVGMSVSEVRKRLQALRETLAEMAERLV